MFHDSRGRNQSSLALDKMKHLRQAGETLPKRKQKAEDGKGRLDCRT